MSRAVSGRSRNLSQPLLQRAHALRSAG